MPVEDTIKEQFEELAIEQHHKLARLNPELNLLECGLDSLGFALIVARLEGALGLDPFEALDEVGFPVTYRDFVKLYENHGK